MALSQAAIQKKKQKKQQKRKAAVQSKLHKITQLQQTPLLQRGEIYECWVSPGILDDTGLGHVIFSRLIPATGGIIMVDFLVDVHCLGVKNTLVREESQYSYAQLLEVLRDGLGNDLEEVEPALAKKLVLDAVAYAQSLGIAPYVDYNRVKDVFADIDETACQTEFAFGCEGKPRLITGPNDTPKQIKTWLKSLSDSCGADGFHYMINADMANLLE
jgi:hypothetical protein